MDKSTRRPLLLAAGVVGLALAAALPGCARDRYYPGMGDGTRVARRPLLAPKEPGRPFFVGGYAGADYNRSTRPTPMRNRPLAIEP